MSDFTDLIKSISDESTGVLTDDMFDDSAVTFMDTGSYMLNALISRINLWWCS